MPVSPGGDDTVEMAGPAQQRIDLGLPAHVYPWFEVALRIAAEESVDTHQRRIAELWQRFNEVARHNPQRLEQPGLDCGRDRHPRAGQPDDQLAAHQADELQQHGRSGLAVLILTRSRWRPTCRSRPIDGSSPGRAPIPMTPYSIAERRDYHRSPAIRIGAGRVLESPASASTTST